MRLSQVLSDILDKPDAPKVYRDLQKHFASIGMAHEAKAFEILIAKRFDRNAIDPPPSGQ